MLQELSTICTIVLRVASDNSVMAPQTAFAVTLGGCYVTLAFLAAGRLTAPSTVHAHRRAAVDTIGLTRWLPAILIALGLQTMFNILEHSIDLIRALALTLDMYAYRRPLQWMVILGLCGAATGLAWLLQRRFHSKRKTPDNPAWLGIVIVTILISLLVLIRAVSLHHVDAIMFQSIGPIPLHWLIECMLMAALGLCLLTHSQTRSPVVRMSPAP